MTFRRYELTMWIEVSDEDALMDAARARAEEEDCLRSDVKDAADALRWLLDNNDMLRELTDHGAQIVDSYCEEDEEAFP